MKYLYVLLTIVMSYTIQGQTIIGEWETFDDKTNEKKALVEIYKTDNLYFAKIIESYTSEEGATCESCKGKQKGQPIIGLVIIENLKEDGDEFNSGTIMDPENGKTYKCYVELEDANKLKVRGFIGFSLLGRTQFWMRKE